MEVVDAAKNPPVVQATVWGTRWAVLLWFHLVPEARCAVWHPFVETEKSQANGEGKDAWVCLALGHLGHPGTIRVRIVESSNKLATYTNKKPASEGTIAFCPDECQLQVVAAKCTRRVESG